MRRTLLLALAALALLGLCTPHAARAQSYTITDLGTFSPTRINSKAQVTGTNYAATPAQAILWSNGTIKPLPPLSTGQPAYGYDINDSGVVCGVAYYAGKGEAVTWAGNTLTLIAGAPSVANGINKTGDVAAKEQYSDFDGNLYIYAALHLASGGIVFPYGKGNSYISSATSINNNGDDAGYVIVPGLTGSFGYFDIPTSGDQPVTFRLTGDTRALPRRINDARQIVGESTGTGPTKAFVWESGHIVALPALAAGLNASAYDINNAGQVVGWATASDGLQHAALWQKDDTGAYQITDINTLLPANSGWGALTIATGINNSGQIVGNGEYVSTGTGPGTPDAFLLSPGALQISFVPTLKTQIAPTVRLRTGYSLSAKLSKFDAAVHVQNADGTPKNGVRVLITLTSKDNGAGHVETKHTNPRVHGWLFKKGAALKDAGGLALDTTTSVPQNTLGGDTSTTGLTLYTDANGDAPFTYVAPEVAGQDTFKATLPDHTDVAAKSAPLAVSVKGLVSMKTVTDFPFALYGVTKSHPANWFAAPGTVNSLRATAAAYASNQTADTALQTAITSLRAYGYDFPNQQPHDTDRGGIIVPSANEILFLNDISLPLGGLFDTSNNFNTPHGGHRDGTNCDIDSKQLVNVAPYTLSGHAIASIAPLSSAVYDTRLKGAQSPFTNTNFYTDSGNHKVFYTDAIRAQMNALVMQIHHERLVQLIHALQAQNASFSNESDHIHVKM